MRVMKRLKEVSLLATLGIALMATAIAVYPSMEVACQAESSVVRLSHGEAPRTEWALDYDY